MMPRILRLLLLVSMVLSLTLFAAPALAQEPETDAGANPFGVEQVLIVDLLVDGRVFNVPPPSWIPVRYIFYSDNTFTDQFGNGSDPTSQFCGNWSYDPATYRLYFKQCAIVSPGIPPLITEILYAGQLVSPNTLVGTIGEYRWVGRISTPTE